MKINLSQPNPIPENPTLEPFITPQNKEQRFCSKCVHLLGNRDYPERHSIWRCGAKENTGTPIMNLVSGELELNLINPFCTDQRKEQLADNRCGLEGKWYEEYKRPQFIDKESLPTLPRKNRITESDLSNL